MAQVELQCGPFRVVSLMSQRGRARPGPGARLGGGRGHQVHERDRRNRQKESHEALVHARWPPLPAGGRSRGRCGSTTTRVVTTRRRRRGRPTLTVYAAASLTTTFERARRRSSRPTTTASTVEFNFAGSSDLVAQIQQGAPADVFASADEANMEKLTADDLQGSDPAAFASNTLEIAVPPGQPRRHRSRSRTSPNPGLNLVICAPEVPCGAAAQTVAESAGVDAEAGQRGAVGHRRARQGHLGRGRRRPGLRHRRDRRGRRRGGHRVPRVQRGRQHSTRSRPSPTARTPTWRRSSSSWC